MISSRYPLSRVAAPSLRYLLSRVGNIALHSFDESAEGMINSFVKRCSSRRLRKYAEICGDIHAAPATWHTPPFAIRHTHHTITCVAVLLLTDPITVHPAVLHLPHPITHFAIPLYMYCAAHRRFPADDPELLELYRTTRGDVED